jgi:hypothetical protein
MSVQLATAAKATVLSKWGAFIPTQLHRAAPGSFFKFHATDASYAIAFAATYIRTFRNANCMTCRASDKIAPGVAAFVTANRNNLDREIHVAPAALTLMPGQTPADAEALLAHEYIHWLSHPNFYPSYYRVGGANPFRVEGFTEWLMMECYPPNAVNIVYQAEYQKTSAWLDADRNNLSRLLNFIFNGVATDLSALHP